MKILIIETGRLSLSTSISHVKNSLEIHKYLNKFSDCVCEIVDSFSHVDEKKQYDIILISSASMHFDFMKFERLIDGQRKCRIGWITNEFELFANDFVKKRMDFIITNFDEKAVKKAHKHNDFLSVNLNVLKARPRNQEAIKKYGCCYYGTYRKYRERYFRKYLRDDTVLLSTSKKNVVRFFDLGVDCRYTDRFSWRESMETLNLFKASLYIEDTKTHDWFNYMADRFFEGLFCNTPLFFDVSCLNTIQKDIYHVDDYFVVNSLGELRSRIKEIDKDKREKFLSHNTELALDEKKKVVRELYNFLGGLV